MLKRRLLTRTGAVIMALAIVLSLAVPMAAAASYPDVKDNYEWAKSYIDDMTAKGLFNGYTDGTFRPGNKITCAEALAVCARMRGFSARLQTSVYADHYSTLAGIFGNSFSHFQREFAICLELGVISVAEMTSLFKSGSLDKPLSRQDFSRFLARIMQVQIPPSSSLYTMGYPLEFNDNSKIAADFAGYIYLLNNNGIIQGDNLGNFNPLNAINRAESAAMFSRALTFMNSAGVVAEVDNFTDYKYVAGDIKTAESGVRGATSITVSEFGRTAEPYSIPSAATVYLNGSLSSQSVALKVGNYIRIRFSSKNEIETVYVYDNLSTKNGTFVDLEEKVLTVKGSGNATTELIANRFTRFLSNGKVGDINDKISTEGVHTVEYVVDSFGNLITARLIGGTRTVRAILTSVTGSNVTVRTFDGTTQTYTPTATTKITIDGADAKLTSFYYGCYVEVIIFTDTGAVSNIAVDSKSTYIQGILTNTTSTTTSRTATISVTGSSSSVYNVSSAAEIYYEDKATALSSLPRNSFVTAQLFGNQLVAIEGYTGTSTIYGTITAITYGTTVLISVDDGAGTIHKLSFDIASPPIIRRDNAASSIERLRVGDEVTVTNQYSQVYRIDAVSKTANVSGILTSITQSTNGYSITLKLSDDTTETYSVPSSVTVIADKNYVSFSVLKPGYKISVVVEGDAVTTIVIDQSVATTTELNGIALVINSFERTILMQQSDNSLVTVYVPNLVTIMTSSGASVTLANLAPGNVIQVFGAYDTNLAFVATLVIKK